MERLNSVTIPMLALIAASLTAPDDIVQLETPGHLAKVFRQHGYTFKPRQTQPQGGTLTKNGTTVQASLYIQDLYQGQDSPKFVAGVQLMVTLRMPKVLPFKAFDRWTQRYGSADVRKLYYNLGPSVNLHTGIDLLENPFPDRTRRMLDQFWKDIEDFKSEYRAKVATDPSFVYELDWAKVKFDDKLVLDRMDHESLMRVISSWGWQRTEGIESEFFRGRPRESTFVIYARDFGVSITRLNPDAPNDDQLQIYSWLNFDSPQSTQNFLMNKPYWADFMPGRENQVVAQTSMDLSRGVRLGDIRRQIEEFASNLRAVDTEGAK